MENRAHALAAGLFVLLLGCAGILAIWWFSGTRETTREVTVVAKQNVSGLNPQAQVRYRGILVGKVRSIRLDPTNHRDILIQTAIAEDVPITSGTRAKLAYQGITGIAHILLEDAITPTDAELEELAGPARIDLQPSLLEEISASGGDLMHSANDLLDKLNDMLNPDNQHKVSQTLTNLQQATAQLGPTIAQVHKALSDENIGRLSRTLENSTAASAEAARLIADARGSLKRLEAVSEHLDQGVIASTGELEAVSGEISRATRQMNRVFSLLERSPQSLLFGVDRPEAGPGEKGFVQPPRTPDNQGNAP